MKKTFFLVLFSLMVSTICFADAYGFMALPSWMLDSNMVGIDDFSPRSFFGASSFQDLFSQPEDGVEVYVAVSEKDSRYIIMDVESGMLKWRLLFKFVKIGDSGRFFPAYMKYENEANFQEDEFYCDRPQDMRDYAKIIGNMKFMMYAFKVGK